MPSFVLQGLSRLGIAGAALVGATTAVLLTKGAHATMRLLLAGVVLGAASSMALLLTPEIMQAMQSFMLGSAAFVGWNACLLMAVVLGGGDKSSQDRDIEAAKVMAKEINL